jgi:hypothetical protein
MERPIIPTEGVITRTASIEIARDVGTVYHYVIDYKVLPEWLGKYGPIHGVRNTVINTASYTFVGANRTIHFDNGDELTPLGWLGRDRLGLGPAWVGRYASLPLGRCSIWDAFRIFLGQITLPIWCFSRQPAAIPTSITIFGL